MLLWGDEAQRGVGGVLNSDLSTMTFELFLRTFLIVMPDLEDAPEPCQRVIRF